jgi:hypothetical protein
MLTDKTILAITGAISGLANPILGTKKPSQRMVYPKKGAS